MTGIHSAFTFIAVLTQSLITTYDALYNNVKDSTHLYHLVLYQALSSVPHMKVNAECMPVMLL